MSRRRNVRTGNNLWDLHDRQFRYPPSVITQWHPPDEIDRRMLELKVEGDWWDAVASTGQTLIVTREYEHLVMAISFTGEKRRVSYLRLPHPSGLAVDRKTGRLYVASTRNPNMIYEFLPCRGVERRFGAAVLDEEQGTLLPDRSRFYPGCLYIHDIALIGGDLYANAVAMNAVVELPESGGYKRAWWPRCVDHGEGLFDRNYLQLNSIAAGKSLTESFFSASAAAPGPRRPGHVNFPVDGRGVIFSGKTRRVIATGLTRPHSARLINGDLWVDNSGYGEVGRVNNGRYCAVARLPGWTRGLYHAGNDVAFVGTSKIIPRFRHYAPGLNWRTSKAGVHAIQLSSGRIIGSLYWPNGNQIFAIQGIPTKRATGFPLRGQKRGQKRRVEQLFFTGRTHAGG